MKFITLLFSLLCFAHFSFGQNIRTVSNYNGDGSTDYDNIQQAIDEASPGDIIHVYPGNYNETGYIYLNKSLHIVGVGYQLFDNNPTLDWSMDRTAFPGIFVIENTGSNSIIEGIDISFLIMVDCNDVIVTKTKIRKASLTRVGGISFRSCFISGGFHGSPHYCQIRLLDTAEISFENCLFDREFNSSSSRRIFHSTPSTTSGIVVLDHCIIRNQLNEIATEVVFNLKNSIGLTNEGNLGGGYGDGTYAINCLLETSFIGPGINCITSISPINEFVGYPNINNYSFDGRYQLLPTSQAIGYGSDGADCGIYDGNSTYVPSGIPRIPFIYNFQADHEGTTGSGIDVNIKVKSQN